MEAWFQCQLSPDCGSVLEDGRRMFLQDPFTEINSEVIRTKPRCCYATTIWTSEHFLVGTREANIIKVLHGLWKACQHFRIQIRYGHMLTFQTTSSCEVVIALAALITFPKWIELHTWYDHSVIGFFLASKIFTIRYILTTSQNERTGNITVVTSEVCPICLVDFGCVTCYHSEG